MSPKWLVSNLLGNLPKLGGLTRVGSGCHSFEGLHKPILNDRPN